jgi:hypothetical protein
LPVAQPPAKTLDPSPPLLAIFKASVRILCLNCLVVGVPLREAHRCHDGIHAIAIA